MVSAEHKLPISHQCRLVDLARSTYYYEPEPVSDEVLQLMRLIDECYLERLFCGSWRVRDWLYDHHGLVVNRKCIQRLRRLLAIETLYPKRNLNLANQQHKVYPYLLRGLEIDRRNQVWSTDITYIPMAKGFVYLVAVMDWYSRRVLSWRVSTTMDSSFCVGALNEAIDQHGSPEIINTDQGSQFTSEEFTGALEAHDIAISMDGKGRWVDNVFVERLWRSVKYEEVYLDVYENVDEATQALARYFEFCDEERRHQSLGKRAPTAVYFNSADKVAA